MKYTTTQTKTVEHEIESFPVFVKFSDAYTKILNEREMLVVNNWEYGGKGIEIVPSGQRAPFGNDGWEFITEQEFDEAFESVLNRINSFSKQPVCD